MRPLLTIISLLVFSLLPVALLCQVPPKLGLVLSGGGAKGLAHIGVLQVLEENGISPDFVSGTSMGSIVGGLYSIGYTPDEMAELTRGIPWEDYFSDSYPRALVPIEERQRSARYLLSFSLTEDGLQLPRGFIQGTKIQTMLGGLTAPVHTQADFDRFYHPFRAVATDLETGSAYVFSGGALRKAIRASMAIPSVFEPLEYDDHLLVDGLLVRNLPVSEALEMGAEVTLAVDVGDALYPREELTSVLRVLEQTTSLGMAASTVEQRALADFIIDPDLDGYSALSYEAADSLIERGRRSAEAALPMLLPFLDSLGIVRGAIPERPLWRRDSFIVRAIEVQAEDPADEKILRRLVSFSLPRILTVPELERQMGLLYGSGFFQMVDYELRKAEGGGYVLWLSGATKPDVNLRLGANYDSDLNAALLLNLTARNQLVGGSVFSADLRIGEYPAAWLDYAIYTRANPSVGVQWQFDGQFLPGFKYEKNRRISEFTFQQFSTSLDFQASISRQWYFKLGLGLERFAENPRFFNLSDTEARLDQAFLYGRFIRDTYDRAYFPTDGSNTNAWIRYTLGGSLFSEEDETISIPARGNLSLGLRLHKVVPVGERLWVDLRTSFGAAKYEQGHFLNQFYLGRAMPAQDRFVEFYGLRLTEQPATAFGLLGVQLRQEIGQGYFAALGYNLGYYFLTEGNLFRAEGGLSEPEEEGRFHGLGLEMGGLTPIGPVRITGEYNIDLDRLNFTFYAGYRF